MYRRRAFQFQLDASATHIEKPGAGRMHPIAWSLVGPLGGVRKNTERQLAVTFVAATGLSIQRRMADFHLLFVRCTA